MDTVVTIAVIVFILYVVVQAIANSTSHAPRPDTGRHPRQERRDWNPEEDIRGDERRCFLLGVAGESFRNGDGSSRQEIIARCSVGEGLQLMREPNNPRDSNAIKICRINGEQIGYVPAEAASRLADELDSGKQFRAEIYAINGGTRKKPSRGVVIRIGVLEMKAKAAAIASRHS